MSLTPSTKVGIWALPLNGDRKPIPFRKTGFNEVGGTLSPVPDSQGHLWMAYQSNETGSYRGLSASVPTWCAGRTGGGQSASLGWRCGTKKLSGGGMAGNCSTSRTGR